jgi:hypothetical protein
VSATSLFPTSQALGSGGGGNGGWFSGLNIVGGPATTGLNNTGGGGGGGYSEYGGGNAGVGGAGGSGIVILRYPSYLAPATSTTGSPEMVVTGGWRVYTFVASGTITF